MKKNKLHHIVAGFFAAALISSVAIAQPYPYAGSDDFNDNSISPSWNGYFLPDTTSGLFVEHSGRLNFTSDAANESRVLVWNNAINNADNENWVASLQVSNWANPTAGYTLMGLQVFASNDLNLGLFGIYAYSGVDYGQRILIEKAAGDYALTSYLAGPNPAAVSNVILQMAHDASTHDITFSFSFDSGATFTTASTVFNPGADWSGDPVDGFSFRILGLSSDDLIPLGVLYADNFSVSAVPEPSTYAAIAGALMLGFAAWKRRAKRA